MLPKQLLVASAGAAEEAGEAGEAGDRCRPDMITATLVKNDLNGRFRSSSAQKLECFSTSEVMKYSSKLGQGDIDYINIKKTISECTAAEFVDQICKSANLIKNDPESVQRNFLGCLKLFKKFEKHRRQLVPRRLIHSIYDVPAFKT